MWGVWGAREGSRLDSTRDRRMTRDKPEGRSNFQLVLLGKHVTRVHALPQYTVVNQGPRTMISPSFSVRLCSGQISQ